MQRLWGREFNCINGRCAVSVASEPENRPYSTNNSTILPLPGSLGVLLDPQENCANRSLKEESIEQIAQNSFLSGKSFLYLQGISQVCLTLLMKCSEGQWSFLNVCLWFSKVFSVHVIY